MSGCNRCHGSGWVTTTTLTGKPRKKRCDGPVKGHDHQTPIPFPQQKLSTTFTPTPTNPTADHLLTCLSLLNAHRSANGKPARTPKLAPNLHRESPLFEKFARHYFTCQLPATVDKARDIAAIAHAGQTCQTGDPYINHPATVSHLILTLPEYRALTEEEQQHAVQSAWLHDTLEDTSIAAEDLERAGFHPNVINAVVSVTKRPGEANSDYYERVKRGGPIAVAVKLADLRHNTNAERRMELPGSPKNPVTNPEHDKYTRLGKKYYLAYRMLGVEPPAHLQQFAA